MSTDDISETSQVGVALCRVISDVIRMIADAGDERIVIVRFCIAPELDFWTTG